MGIYNTTSAYDTMFDLERDVSTLQFNDDGPFGPTGASRYDEDAQFMAERYEYANRAQTDFAIKVLQRSNVDCAIAVDIGCGTSSTGLSILSQVPSAKYIGIDISAPMILQSNIKLKQFIDNKRAVLINNNMFNIDLYDELADQMSYLDRSMVSCIICSFVLHHLSVTQKKIFLEKIARFISNCSYFIFTDLFSNKIDICNEIAIMQELEDIRNIHRLASDCGNPICSKTTISENHYQYENSPQILLEELALLRDVGFGSVDIIYRSSQVAVIVAGR